MAAASPPRPRVMVLPFPAQGHVMPLMELSRRLADHGFEVDFVNTEYNQARVLAAMAAAGGEAGAAAHTGIRFVSVPDGMGPDGDRTDIFKLGQSLPAAMLGRLEEVVRARNTRWVVVDVSMGWALDLAATAGVRIALFLTYSAAVFVLGAHIPKLIEDGIIDESGNVKRNEKIQLSPKMPTIAPSELPWTGVGKSPESRRAILQALIKSHPALITLADAIICNTFQEIESEALSVLSKKPLVIGPLVAAKSTSASHFWPEDLTSLAWLDAQEPSSVVYVAFGSYTVFDTRRLQELADGLELTGRPFLWVVRPNFADGVDESWLHRCRVGGKGLMVGWAPQQRVLSHPSVACFISHCGWNSTMEGVRHGVPFLCWPYFADQFLNQSYICDLWGAGLRICADERGIVTKEEIRDKVEEEIRDKVARLLGDEGIKARALSLKSKACTSITDGGPSHQDLLKLVNLLREE